MSQPTDPDFDLEKLFLPAWAQESADKNRYSDFEGETERSPRRGRPGRPRPPGRGPMERDRRPDRGPRSFERGERRPERGDDRDRGRGPGQPPGRGRGRGRRPEFQRPVDLGPLPELNVAFMPDDQGVDSLTRQIRITGRAYPLIEIARMILQKPERHAVVLSVKKNAEGQLLQPLYLCALDGTAWLSEEEAVRHVLRRHFDLFYQTERTAVEPPKGTYTFVAQCGMSGVILGPPNHHEYQKQLHKLHAERFSRMPFETFKSRVRIVRDEEVVKQWIEEQSYQTEYVCLNMPETVRLTSREAVEEHFRAHHLGNIIQQVESIELKTPESRNVRTPNLQRLIRRQFEEQRRFPIQVMTVLSQQFGARGLQFFKVNRTVTHVTVARPHYLDLESTPVSDGVRRIVDFVREHPGGNRKELVESLAPTPAPPPIPLPVAPPVAEPPPSEAAEVGEGVQAAPSPAPAPAPPAATPEPTPEQTVVISDLHWLVHQGHVIEFANGVLELAKKPNPRPPKQPKQEPTPVSDAGSDTTTTPASGPGSEEGSADVAVANPPSPTEPIPPEPAVSEPTEERPDSQDIVASPGNSCSDTSKPASAVEPQVDDAKETAAADSVVSSSDAPSEVAEEETQEKDKPSPSA